MKIVIDLEELDKLNLSPTEYVVLKLIEENQLIQYPVLNDRIFESLYNKGWLDINKKLIKSIGKDSQLDQWLSLWPTFVIPQNYRISGNYQDCKYRMEKFIKKYGYSWDVIMEATKSYLNRQKKNNWNMTKKNVKFIYDNDGSLLAEECEAWLTGDREEEKPNHYFI